MCGKLQLPRADSCPGLCHFSVTTGAAGRAGAASLQLFQQAALRLPCREGAFAACGLSTDTVPLMAPGPAPF